jgi:hypothetical protein
VKPKAELSARDTQSLVPPPFLRRLSLLLGCASAVTILLSIAVSQVLLALALSVLLLSGLPLRWPRIAIPLGLFLVWTLVALSFSPDPAFGIPSVRKAIVYLMLLIVYSSVRTLAEAEWLVLAWLAIGTFTAGRGLVQFAGDIAGARAAHTDFYDFYIADRIRGFMSHWMTFSGQELYILLLIAAFLLYAPNFRRYIWLLLPCGIAVGLALILSETRTVWVASVVAGFYLLWNWKKWAAPDSGAGEIVSRPSWHDRFERTAPDRLAHGVANDQGAPDRWCGPGRNPEA